MCERDEGRGTEEPHPHLGPSVAAKEYTPLLTCPTWPKGRVVVVVGGSGVHTYYTSSNMITHQR